MMLTFLFPYVFRRCFSYLQVTFFCSISPCALMVSLVNSFSMTGTPMLNVPFSMPSWMLFFSIVLERITGMEISTPFCFLIALLTLNPNYKMNMFCYKKQREMMKLSKMVTLVISSLLLFIIVRFCKNVLVSGCKIIIIFPLIRIHTSPSLLPNSEPLFLIHSHLYRTVTLVGLVAIYYFTTY